MDKVNKWGGSSTWGVGNFRTKDGAMHRTDHKVTINAIGARTNIWRYVVSGGFGHKDRSAYKHPATFPIQLAIDHIKSWTNEGDLVYDPMLGSGTVAIAATQLKRNWIGSEISKEYCDLIRERLADPKNIIINPPASLSDKTGNPMKDALIDSILKGENFE